MLTQEQQQEQNLHVETIQKLLKLVGTIPMALSDHQAAQAAGASAIAYFLRNKAQSECSCNRTSPRTGNHRTTEVTPMEAHVGPE
jgi:hypothetical protein